MYNLYETLPNTIEVNGRVFPIYTDFKIWLKFSEVASKQFYTSEISFIFEIPNDVYLIGEDEIDAIFNFYYCKPKYPISTGEGVTAYSFKDDAQYIYASFMKTYGINLLEAKMHWWEFMALFRGLTNQMSDIIQYRCYNGDDKEMLKIKEEWRIKERPKGDKDIIKTLLHGGDFTKGG